MGIRFVHTNLIARDWRKLAKFYVDVFECKIQYPERDLHGKWVDRLTNMENVRIKGAHLVLPGYDNGPTLEIFEYDPAAGKSAPEINRPGFAHIAFHVHDVEAVLARLIDHGGKPLGGVVRQEFEKMGLLTAVYARDPEGNLLEIQNWHR